MSQELTPRLHPASGTVTIPDTVIPHGGIVHGGEINLSPQLTLITVSTSFSLNFDGRCTVTWELCMLTVTVLLQLKRSVQSLTRIRLAF
jgi:hypothetical protein